MDLLSITVIAIGLSMDALAISIANGFMIKQLHFKFAFRIAFFFGLFQAVMPVIGWSAGHYFISYVEKFDHWVAFLLLTFIGIKMIFESKKIGNSNNEKSKDCTHFPTLILLSFATSMDALAVGISFSLLNINILTPVIIIGTITFAICISGVYLGDKVGHLFENRMELAGGIILIGIGIKILFLMPDM